MARIVITDWVHERIRQMTDQPKRAIDATAGTGKDTVFLLDMVGKNGHVLSMDIQEMAIEKTKNRLKDHPLSDHVTLVLDSHENIDCYEEENTVDLIMFNLGYLPGGDHTKMTKPKSTIAALTKSLSLLKPGGLLSLIIYSGGDSGYEEKEAVLDWLKQLDAKKYTVVAESFFNKPNDPPLPVYVLKTD